MLMENNAAYCDNEVIGKINLNSKPAVPIGMWIKCEFCKKLIYKKELEDNNYICKKCGSYYRMPSLIRIESVVDEDSFKEWFDDIPNSNPIDFPDYDAKIEKIRKDTGLCEAVIIGEGSICSQKVVIGACDTRFLMGSMGQIVGEKITRAFEIATQEKMPVIIFCCSGGARMQEGIVSLMQMAKTAAAVKSHSDEKLLYISVLTDPTTGGVAASFSMLGDIILAEPGALVGFAGPRVIERTINQKLPDGFQSSEFLLKHGLIDAIVERKNLRKYLGKVLNMHQAKDYILSATLDYFDIEDTTSVCDSWEKVQISRKSDRPTTLDYINSVFEDFVELHGDHIAGDDEAIVGGIGTVNGVPITVIGHQKGKTVEENIRRNFAMAHPEGYRKALRLMKEAEKFGRAVITFVDTPGAACGIEAEKRGVSMAIAKNLYEMSELKVPILSILIGEGGSGGALGLALSNKVWALENATYSVLSPEGFASILWKDAKKAKAASALMKMTADELKRLKVIDLIILEKKPISVEDMTEISEKLKNLICTFLVQMQEKSEDEIKKMRYDRYRNF